MKKITFKAKILFEENLDYPSIITYEQIDMWIKNNEVEIKEIVLPWDNSAEPTIILGRTR